MVSRITECQTRWNSPKQLYNEYLSNYQSAKRETITLGSQAKIPRIPIIKLSAQTEEVPIKRIQFESVKNGTPNSHEQTKILNSFKEGLSNLRYDVTRLISTHREYMPLYDEVKEGRNECQETSRTNFSQNSTVVKKPQESDSRLLDETAHKINSPDNMVRREEIRRFPLEEHLTGHTTQRTRTVGSLAQAAQRRYEIMIQGLKRQMSQLQTYYQQKLDDSQRIKATLQSSNHSKQRQLANLKNEISCLQNTLKAQEQKGYQKTIENLQQKNRKLEKQIFQLSVKFRTSEAKLVQMESKVTKTEEMLKTTEIEKSKLFDETLNLKQNISSLNRELTLNKEAFEQHNEQIKELEQIKIERDNLRKSIEKQSKCEMTKSSIVPSVNQNLLEQAKKQEIDKLNSKIEQLKKKKRIVQQQLKSLNQTKEIMEQALRKIPNSKSHQQLRNQITQKDQLIATMIRNGRDLQEQKLKNERLQHRLRASDALLRETNEILLKKELTVLNKKYK